MEQVKIYDKVFDKFIDEVSIKARIREIAEVLNKKLVGKDILFLGILNGSFMIVADLYREITLDSSISFLKMSSYVGTESTGKITELIGLNEELEGKTVVVVEDIVDTGNTLNNIIKDLRFKGAESIIVVTLLFKPDAYNGEHKIDYAGFEIPNDFVVGYGLDYNGRGRNLPAIYKLSK